MEREQASVITVELALRWASKPAQAHRSYWAKRLIAIRLFARYRSATDPRTEVPPDRLLPCRPNRARPYPYTEEDIDRLMNAAATLPPPGGLRAQSYSCLLGLLVVTGLRIGEALRLESEDVDLQDGLLEIRSAKFGKSRIVPLHHSAQQALLIYSRRRDDCLGRTPGHFLVSARGTPLSASAVRRTFRTLCRKVGLRGSGNYDEPRLHHFRHRFATETLLRWYRSTEDVERLLPVLSAFLGHASIADTYWYLSARPELMREAVQRLERRWEESS